MLKSLKLQLDFNITNGVGNMTRHHELHPSSFAVVVGLCYIVLVLFSALEQTHCTGMFARVRTKKPENPQIIHTTNRIACQEAAPCIGYRVGSTVLESRLYQLPWASIPETGVGG